MKLSLSLLILLSVACQPLEQLQQRARGVLGLDRDDPAPAAAEFTPAPPPTLESDKVVQLGPKEKVLTLFEQFNRAPDDYLAGLIVNELTQNRGLFTATEDGALKHVLNRLIAGVQQGQPQTLNLLLQIQPLLLGANKELVRSVLARAFDSVPLELMGLLLKRGEDKLCYLASIVPPEIAVEEKVNFLTARRDQLLELKLDPALGAAQLAYLETCVRTIELTTTPPPPAPEPAPVAEPVAPAAPVTP